MIAGGAGRPLIDPRFRERQIAVRRHAGRRRLLIAGILAGALSLGAGGLALLHSSLLAVRTVRVTGVTHTSRARVLSAAHLSRLMIDVEGASAAQRIERLPWVADARFERHWPSSVQISVTERKPVGVVGLPGAAVGPPGAAVGPPGAAVGPPGAAVGPQAEAVAPPGGGSRTAPAGGSLWALVDRTGRVLADVSQPPPGLVVLSGVGDPGQPGSLLAPGADPALNAVADLGPSLAQRVATVDAVGGGLEMVLRPVPGTPVPVALQGGHAATGRPAAPPAITNGPTVVLGGADQLGAKLQALALLVNQVDLSGVRSVDLRVPQSPALTRR